MEHPKQLKINDFSYSLPEEKIARFPLAEREQSRLLIYKNGSIAEDRYREIALHLPAGALLVFNKSKVLEARLLFEKPSGGVIEIFILEPHSRYNDISTGISQLGKVYWKCLVGGASKWKHGQVLSRQVAYPGGSLVLAARITEQLEDGFIIEFAWQPETMRFDQVLERCGQVPIPPYLKRAAEPADAERYQTVYATDKGSVAAPTAGLHFTGNVFQSLTGKNIHSAFLTLHVGAGTFLPVKSETLEGHLMHSEFMEVERAFVRTLMEHVGNTFAVGTTSLRTLESLYWMGLKCYQNQAISIGELEITQWEVYDHLGHGSATVDQALGALLSWMEQRSFEKLVLRTGILIAPGYPVKTIRGLITNFHQPNSTLLLLVAALIGDDWKKVYGYALENGMRFLSYGDGCLLYVP